MIMSQPSAPRPSSYQRSGEWEGRPMRDSRLRRWLAIVVFFVGPFGPTVALAQEPRAGVVTTVEGQALLGRPTLSQPVSLKFKDDLFVRDRVETKEDSIVRVLLGG